MLTSEEILEKGEWGQYKDTPGEHYFSICAMCGQIKWARSEGGGGTAVGRIIIKSDHRTHHDVPFICDECKDIERRYPDVYEWMQKVLTAHLKRHHE